MNYFSATQISYDTAARAVALAMEIAPQHGVRPVVSVADRSMSLVAFGVADGATPHSTETSTRKAQTSASTGRPTGAIPEALQVALPLATGGNLTAVDGGVPLIFGGVHVGGLGVAGGPPAVDAQIAREVLARLGADPLPE